MYPLATFLIRRTIEDIFRACCFLCVEWNGIDNYYRGWLCARINKLLDTEYPTYEEMAYGCLAAEGNEGTKAIWVALRLLLPEGFGFHKSRPKTKQVSPR